MGDADHGQDMFSYEMGLRQFRSISDLMSKLMYDLQVSYDSFVTEFIRFPNNGVTRLCDLLKVIQLSQTNHKSASHHSSSGGAGVRTVQSDEFQTLLCLKVTITDFKYRIIPLSSTERNHLQYHPGWSLGWPRQTNTNLILYSVSSHKPILT